MGYTWVTALGLLGCQAEVLEAPCEDRIASLLLRVSRWFQIETNAAIWIESATGMPRRVMDVHLACAELSTGTG
jgi:hypothetical protein